MLTDFMAVVVGSHDSRFVGSEISSLSSYVDYSIETMNSVRKFY